MRARLAVRLPALILALLIQGTGLAQAQGFKALYTRDGIDIWAVGDGGVVYRSFDGGLGYTDRTLGNKTLWGVAVRNFNAVVVGDSGKIWHSLDSGGNWALTVVGGAPSLRGVEMPSDLVGYVVGAAGQILKTTDGGGSWTPQTSGTAAQLNAVRFTSDNTGWAVGNAGTVLKTTNGGASWTPVATGAVNDLNAIDISGSTLWAVGDRGAAVRSLDGGTNWSPVNLRLGETHADVKTVWLESPSTVFLGGGGGFIRRSTDGGTTWDFLQHSMQAQISDLFFVGSNGWACSNKNRVVMFTTDDGGFWRIPSAATISRSWEARLPFAGSGRGNTISINGSYASTVYAALGTTLYRSSNDAEDWLSFGTPIPGTTKVNAFIVSPKDSNVMVAAASGIDPDHIVRTEDGGLTWTTYLTLPFGEYGVPVAMDPDHPDTLLFGGDRAELYRSTDFGKTWSAWMADTAFRSPCNIVVVPDSSNIVLVGDGVTGSGQGQYFRSTDYGQTFTLQATRPVGASELPGMACARLRNSTCFGTNWGSGGVQRSTDYGVSWPSALNLFSSWGVDIARGDPNCVIVGLYSGGNTYLSLDGGTTFIFFPLSGSNYALYARDRGFMLAEQSGGIYKMRASYGITTDNTQALFLNAPVGGEVWPAGSVQHVTWDSQNMGLVRIEYRTGPSDPWQFVANMAGYRNSYEWTVPPVSTTHAMVRISDAWAGTP